MAEDGMAGPAIAGRALLSAALGAAGTGAMGLAGGELLGIAGASAGTEALIAWVLVGAAALGALLCLRLTVVWGLATAVLVAGPTGRAGAAFLAALRVLAPRLARRLTAGAALATAATALTFGPALAAPASVLLEDDEVHDAPVQQAAQMLTVDAPAPSDGGGEDEATAAGSPPPLGWGEAAPRAPAADATRDEAAPQDAHGDPQAQDAPADTPASNPSPADAGTESSTSTATDTDTATDTERTVIVHTGDSLWSISRDLLGQGAATDPEIAAAWPLLHAANQDRIGADPDLLHPGLELVVPAELTLQDTP